MPNDRLDPVEATLRSWGWSSFFQSQIDDLNIDGEPARIVSASRQTFNLRSADSTFTLRLRQTRHLSQRPTTGDWLLCDPNNHEPLALLERKNWLQRRRSGHAPRPQLMLANFEHIFLVTSANQDFNESRLERGLVLAAQSGVKATIVLTKVDQCDDATTFRDRLATMHGSPTFHAIDARDTTSCQRLGQLQHSGQTTALLGSSGVGKSTLINTLIGQHAQATQPIRERDAKGRHTTVRRTLIQLPSGGLVVDNPGVRELGVFEAEAAVAQVFDDIVTLATKCRFSNCQHAEEPGCAVRAALQTGDLDRRRFDNYMKLRLEASPVPSYD